jgi:hypothetical protein
LNGLPETFVRGDGGTEFRSGAMVLRMAVEGAVDTELRGCPTCTTPL